MARTSVKGTQVLDESIQREDLCSTVPGKSVIKKLIAGVGISITSSGVDDGTGDVIVSADTSSVKQYIHEQSIPSIEWVMQHEFIGYPEVIVLDEDGNRVYCDLVYPDNNNVVARFNEPFLGKAALTITKSTQLEFYQSMPSSTWVITHNLNRYPDVIAFDSSVDNIRIYGDVRYASLDSLSVVFNSPIAGKIYLV